MLWPKSEMTFPPFLSPLFSSYFQRCFFVSLVKIGMIWIKINRTVFLLFGAYFFLTGKIGHNKQLLKIKVSYIFLLKSAFLIFIYFYPAIVVTSLALPLPLPPTHSPLLYVFPSLPYSPLNWMLTTLNVFFNFVTYFAVIYFFS